MHSSLDATKYEAVKRRPSTPMDTLAPSPSPYASRQASPSLLSRESYVVNGGSNPDIIPSSSNGNSNSGTASAPRSLALKISRLLSTSLEDAGTRTALETLDEFGLADGDNDAETATTKTSRGNAAEGKSARTRRLRAEIDRRLLADSNRFLVAFKDVNDVGDAARKMSRGALNGAVVTSRHVRRLACRNSPNCNPI